jgi:hypothetical protein
MKMKIKIIKRLIMILIAAACISGVITPALFISVSANDNDNIRIFIEGTLITPRDARGNIVQPLLIDGTTFLPVRAIGEAFGKEVHWDSAIQSVFIGSRPRTAPTRGSHIKVFIDGTQITPRDARGNTVQPFIRNGTTFLPVRAIGEAFGKEIYWDSRNSSVFVGRGTFTITAGRRTHTVTMADILALSPRSVTANPRGETRRYTGVPLADILIHAGVNHTGTNTVVFTSEDGFSAALTIAEDLDTRNTFIAIEQDRQPLGTIETDGRGPFMSVVAQDPFTNRFARYLTNITFS